MKKTVHRSKKNQAKLHNFIIWGMLGATVILIAALIIVRLVAPQPTDYVVTADGHVHAADGTHLGNAEDVLGAGYVVTEDGHVHAADGTHLGTYDSGAEADDHEHAEETEN